MFILSPKSNFLGGSLVSISHLAKLVGDSKLLIWKNHSNFLEVNNVHGTVINGWNHFIDMTFPEHDELQSIWCNDTCVDKGYYPEVLSENLELWHFLKFFKNVHLVNHQPINRYRNYLLNMIEYLYSTGVENIYIYNYRACWNTEWNNELKAIFPDVKVSTLPYHYYYQDIIDLYGDEIEQKINSETGTRIASIGRSSSKCKIQSRYEDISKLLHGFKLSQIYPDNNCNNISFVKKLLDYDYVLTGYYYGGEGDKEIDEYHNHLEWSFMDALLMGCIPITSSLFNKELLRLGIYAPVIDYNLHNSSLVQLRFEMNATDLNEVIPMKEARQRLIRELDYGNNVIKKILRR